MKKSNQDTDNKAGRHLKASSENRPLLPLYLTEFLHRNRVDVVTDLPSGKHDMVAFLIIVPIREHKPTDWETRLAPTVSYELRYIRHHRKFTETEWGTTTTWF